MSESPHLSLSLTSPCLCMHLLWACSTLTTLFGVPFPTPHLKGAGYSSSGRYPSAMFEGCTRQPSGHGGNLSKPIQEGVDFPGFIQLCFFNRYCAYVFIFYCETFSFYYSALPMPASPSCNKEVVIKVRAIESTCKFRKYLLF